MLSSMLQYQNTLIGYPGTYCPIMTCPFPATPKLSANTIAILSPSNGLNLAAIQLKLLENIDGAT